MQYNFTYDIDEQVTVKSLKRSGWVSSIIVTRDKRVQYLVQPAAAEGERPSSEVWYNIDDLEKIETPKA